MKPTLPGIDEIRVVSAAGKTVMISSDDVAVEVMQDFAKALDAIERIDTDSEADAGKYQYKYASLPHVLAEVKRVCQLFGFSVSQTPSGTLDGLVVTVSTMLIHHRTGATLNWDPIVFKMSSDPQGVGSAISYARRYALCTIFEIPVGDDDGRRARDAANEPQYRSRAEAEIRRLLADMNQEPRTALTAAFKEHFGSNLAGLDPTRDGEALTWVQEQIAERAVADASF